MRSLTLPATSVLMAYLPSFLWIHQETTSCAPASTSSTDSGSRAGRVMLPVGVFRRGDGDGDGDGRAPSTMSSGARHAGVVPHPGRAPTHPADYWARSSTIELMGVRST